MFLKHPFSLISHCTSRLSVISRGQLRHRSTIFSLCSGQGRCGVAVFRVSGTRARDVLTKMTTIKHDVDNFRKKQMHVTTLIDPETGHQIDQALVLWFPEPKSLTGEDVCELQTHGGTAIKHATLHSLSSLHNFRHAEAGEFIRRSFENQKLDLTQVEGLGDLINAETSSQRKQALSMYKGEMAESYAKWTETLIKSMAHVEALIDFGEEEHLHQDVLDNVTNEVTRLRREIGGIVGEGGKRGVYERVREGMEVCIVGRTNVGKSSLLNRLCKRDAAIVSKKEGTTRDVIEVTLTLGGQLLKVKDTAGLRGGVRDEVEALGMEKSKECLKTSDIIICVVDASDFEVAETFNGENGGRNGSFNKELSGYMKGKSVNRVEGREFDGEGGGENDGEGGGEIDGEGGGEIDGEGGGELDGKEGIGGLAGEMRGDGKFEWFVRHHLEALGVSLDERLERGQKVLMVFNKADLLSQHATRELNTSCSHHNSSSASSLLSSSSSSSLPNFSSQSISIKSNPQSALNVTSLPPSQPPSQHPQPPSQSTILPSQTPQPPSQSTILPSQTPQPPLSSSQPPPPQPPSPPSIYFTTTSCHQDTGLQHLETQLQSIVSHFCQDNHLSSAVAINHRHLKHLHQLIHHLDHFILLLSSSSSSSSTPVSVSSSSSSSTPLSVSSPSSSTSHIADFSSTAGFDAGLELSAESLRLALGDISAITGRVSAEMILDRIFSDFCIGK